MRLEESSKQLKYPCKKYMMANGRTKCFKEWKNIAYGSVVWWSVMWDANLATQVHRWPIDYGC